MKYLGKKIITYDNDEFIAAEYKIPIKFLSLLSKKELNNILITQIRFEEFELASKIKDTITDKIKS